MDRHVNGWTDSEYFDWKGTCYVQLSGGKSSVKMRLLLEREKSISSGNGVTEWVIKQMKAETDEPKRG